MSFKSKNGEVLSTQEYSKVDFSTRKEMSFVASQDMPTHTVGDNGEFLELEETEEVTRVGTIPPKEED